MNTHEDKINEGIAPHPIDTAKENRVRKHWIISLWIMTIINFTSLFSRYYDNAVENEGVVDPSSIVILFFAAAVIAYIPFIFSYYFAYKDRGIKLLTWTLILLPFAVFAGLSQRALHLAEMSAAEILWLLIPVGGFTLYWINSFRLRQVNSKRKKAPPIIDIAKENNVREHWLISLCLYTILSAFIVWIGIVENHLTPEMEDGEVPLLFLMGAITLSFIHFLISYYCSYKNRGTKWLSWLIVIIPIREISDFKDTEWEGFSLLDLSVVGVCWLLFLYGIILYYWINCFRLHTLNLARKKLLKA